MPRSAPYGKTEYHYQEFDVAQDLSLPNDHVGRKSATPEVDFSGVEKTGSTHDHGLESGVPVKDKRNTYANLDPAAMLAEKLETMVQSVREVRVSNLVMDAATYGANAVTLAAADYFSNADFDAKGFLLEKLDEPLVRPNQIVMGNREWLATRQNPSLVASVQGNSGTSGAITREQLAALLEVDEVIIGRSRYNVAKIGAPANYKRTWSGGIAMLHTDPVAARQGGDTVMFGYTPTSFEKVAMRWDDRDVGLRGGEKVRVGESVNEQLIAPELCSYFIKNVVAPI
jgi:hypothetical protein